MDSYGNGCLDGRVTGINSIIEKSVYHAVYDNGHVKGPRVQMWSRRVISVIHAHSCFMLQWFLSYSEHDMALVGVLYQPPPSLPATSPKTVMPNVTPPFDFT